MPWIGGRKGRDAGREGSGWAKRREMGNIGRRGGDDGESVKGEGRSRVSRSRGREVGGREQGGGRTVRRNLPCFTTVIKFPV